MSLAEIKLEFEIKDLERKLESAKKDLDFWSSKESQEKTKPSIPGTHGYGYVRFLKQKRKSAQDDIKYYSEKLEKSKAKLLFI